MSVVRATLPSLKGSVLRDFIKVMQDMNIWGECKFNKSELICTFPNGSWVEFFSCDNEQKLRGRKRQILYVNEGNELKFIEWQQLQMRTTKFSIIDYNPSFTDDHWLCTLNKEPKTYHFITTYKDNPFLEQKVIDEIESLKHKNPSLWRIYGLGLQAMVEGLIFENVEEIDEIPRWHKKHHYRGMDFGYTNDPTAIVDVYINDGTLWIDEVCYQTHMLAADIIHVLKKANKECGENVEIISESADPRLIDEIANAGLDIHPVRKFSGSIMAGIQKMQEMKICVTRRSTNVLKEFRNYTYRQNKEGKWLNEPIDAYNHCFVGSTLILTKCGLKRISQMQVGEYVLTSKGYRRVKKVFANGNKQVNKYTITSVAGDVYTLICTPNHRIKTKQGWKQVQELTQMDTLYTYNDLTAKTTNYTRAKNTIPEERNAYTELYGNTTMAQSPRGITYTTKITTHTTTKYQILKCLTDMTIFQIMLAYIVKMKNILLRLVKTWIMLAFTRTSGIVRTLVVNGIQFMQGLLRNLFSLKTSSAFSVAHRLSQRKEMQSSAQIIASQSTDESCTLMMKNASAFGVEKLSLSTNIQEVNAVQEFVLESIHVQDANIQKVYDIEVEDVHEYYANGILVHNCLDGIRYVVLDKLLGQNSNGLDADEFIDLM